jgi:hypothetical protein
VALPGKEKSKTFIEEMRDALGFRATGRKIFCADDTFELRETITPYGKDSDLGNRGTSVIYLHFCKLLSYNIINDIK